MPKPAISTLWPGFIVPFSMALFRAIGTLDDDVLPIFSISKITFERSSLSDLVMASKINKFA